MYHRIFRDTLSFFDLDHRNIDAMTIALEFPNSRAEPETSVLLKRLKRRDASMQEQMFEYLILLGDFMGSVGVHLPPITAHSIIAAPISISRIKKQKHVIVISFYGEVQEYRVRLNLLILYLQTNILLL
jgi:hypothetical protein